MKTHQLFKKEKIAGLYKFKFQRKIASFIENINIYVQQTLRKAGSKRKSKELELIVMKKPHHRKTKNCRFV